MGEWEYEVSRIIIDRYNRKLMNALRCDVLITGAGPAGLVAGYYLAGNDVRVTIIEKKLAPGGGIWGGGMERNEVVVQEEARFILDEIGIAVEPEGDGFYALDAGTLASGLAFKALQEGATLLNLVTVEDVMIEDKRLTGLVINATGVMLARMHVDPLTLAADAVMDGTGHDAVLASLVQSHGYKLDTETGSMKGQGPMEAQSAENFVVDNTRQVFPGLFLAGMSVAAVHGGPRMGPIFGGMILSGKKAADMILEELRPKG
ncbi:MAG: sulfide-dependent adenosine diphosphate thiazole synthase [bacterium]